MFRIPNDRDVVRSVRGAIISPHLHLWLNFSYPTLNSRLFESMALPFMWNKLLTSNRHWRWVAIFTLKLEDQLPVYSVVYQ